VGDDLVLTWGWLRVIYILPPCRVSRAEGESQEVSKFTYSMSEVWTEFRGFFTWLGQAAQGLEAGEK
jgi:hypothetical protein